MRQPQYFIRLFKKSFPSSIAMVEKQYLHTMNYSSNSTVSVMQQIQNTMEELMMALTWIISMQIVLNIRQPTSMTSFKALGQLNRSQLIRYLAAFRPAKNTSVWLSGTLQLGVPYELEGGSKSAATRKLSRSPDTLVALGLKGWILALSLLLASKATRYWI